MINLNSLLEIAPICILVVDEADTITYSNQLAIDYFGLDYKSEPKPTVRKLFTSSKIKWDLIKEQLSQRKVLTFNVSVRKITGGVIEAFFDCRKIHSQNQWYYILFIRDISDQQIIIRELFKEQQFTKLILDTIPTMVFVKDLENRIVSVNKAFEEITGLKLAQIKGKKVTEIIEDKELANKYWQDDLEVIRTGLPKRKIIEPLLNDPTRLFVTDKIPFKTIDNEIVGVLGHSYEITERVNAEKALLESERRFRLLFDTSPEGAFLCSFDGKIVSANAAFLSMLGYTEEDLPKINYFDLIPEEEKDNELPILEKSIHFGDTVESVERRFKKKDGTLLPVLVRGWIVKDQNGQPVQFGAFIKDITYQKIKSDEEESLKELKKTRLEEDLEEKNLELSSKIAQLIEKNDLVNYISQQLDELISKKPENIFEKLTSLADQIRQEKSDVLWSQFDLTFSRFNKTFFDNLLKDYPNLTNNEKRICAFLRMNLSTKDISNVTKQSIRSIEMARTRLRKKLGLKRSDNLVAFLSKF